MADDVVFFRLVAVDTRKAKAAIFAEALAARRMLLERLQEQWHAANTALLSRLDAHVEALNRPPVTTEEYDAAQQFADCLEQASLLPKIFAQTPLLTSEVACRSQCCCYDSFNACICLCRA